MKNLFTIAVLVGFVLSGKMLSAQMKSLCETCFSSEIVSADRVSDQCTNYQIKVFYAGQCAHDLSHFTVAVPSCARVSNLTNDAGFTEVFGYDPTTGLAGFKIDSVSNFGSSTRKSFLVSFTLCAQPGCSSVSCWSPEVAYKAGMCFELDTLRAICTKLQAHLTQKNPKCAGSANGQLAVVIDNGVAPFQYAWSNNATTSSLTNLPAGNYSVQVTDALGSNVTLTTSLVDPSAIDIQSTVTNASCNGVANGSIVLSVTGGAGSYTYSWNNGGTSARLDSLHAGSFTVTVTDSLGCQARKSIVVDNDKTITLMTTTRAPACGQSNGGLTLTATGGVRPYTYLWSTGATDSTVTNLASGTYSVIVSDAEGCSATMGYNLHENNTLKISYSVTPTSCLDNGSGAISVSVTGGTQPYSFVWSNGDTTKNVQNLTSGSYTVTVSDSLGCQMSSKITVFKKTFQVSSHIAEPRCGSDSTGSISIVPSGGVAPYQFQWSNGSTADSIGNLAPGVYKVSVTDSTGCASLFSYTISSPPTLQALTSISNSSCSSFDVSVQVLGGTQPYQYQWSNGANTSNLTSVPPGTYEVMITDANQCTLNKSVTIDSVATFSCVINQPGDAPVCSSSGNRISTSVAGAIYQWALTSSDGSWLIQSGAASDTLVYQAGNANTTATFTVTITKAGCTQTCSYTASSCSGGQTGGGSHNESCQDCFKSTLFKNSDDGSCAKFTVQISTDGNCRYDLSHLVVAIPCGQLSDYSDSQNYPLVVGKDPTTGLTGLKVDNVTNFGDQPKSFTLEFTVCYSADCASMIQNWNPVVAYKAGQCIAFDTLSVNSSDAAGVAYPNPFHESFSIDVTPGTDDEVTVELYNQFGNRVGEPVSAPVQGSVKNTIKVDAASLPQNLYFYKVKTSKASYYGRVMKIN